MSKVLAEIRCQLKKEGITVKQRFISAISNLMEGEIETCDGRILLPNDLYILTKDSVPLYCHSQCN
ncbi:MAG: DUF3872 domain-containing protein [Prevotellaceae bacterium]|nr:DUF3872 domain-containing protein [Prevotellaceae bacterium]